MLRKSLLDSVRKKKDQTQKMLNVTTLGAELARSKQSSGLRSG